MRINEIITEIDSVSKDNISSFYKELMTFLRKKYLSITEDIIVSDFVIFANYHSITFINQNNFLKMELHNDRLEININHFEYLLFSTEISLKLIYLFMDSSLKGLYTVKIYKNKIGRLLNSEIEWNDVKLSAFNRKEKNSLIAIDEGEIEIETGINYMR